MEMSVFRQPSGQGPRTSRIVDIGAKPEQSKLEQQMAEICLKGMTRKSYLPHPRAFYSLEGACWFCLRDHGSHQSRGRRACLSSRRVPPHAVTLMILIEYAHAGM